MHSKLPIFNIMIAITEFYTHVDIHRQITIYIKIPLLSSTSLIIEISQCMTCLYPIINTELL